MPDHKNLAAALAAFQAELPKIRKDETAKVTGQSKGGGSVSYSYTYAGLDQVVEQVLPVLGKHGLSISAGTVFIGDTFMLEVTLAHETGENERTGVWPLPDPRRAGQQELGSAMTYGRRYLTLALTGTFPGDEDDDGAKAQAYQRDSWENAQPKQQAQQQPEPPKPPKKDWSKANDTEVTEFQQKIEKAPSISDAVKMYDWMAKVGLHNRPVAHPDEAVDAVVTATEVLSFLLADEAAKASNGDMTVADLDAVKEYAESRGLMKVQVSESTTLAEEIGMAYDTLKDIAEQKAIVENAQASDPRDDQSLGSQGSEND